jgi:hypothetical protein
VRLREAIGYVTPVETVSPDVVDLGSAWSHA